MKLVKIFSHSVGFLFGLFIVSWRLFSFRKSHLLIVVLSVYAIGVIFREWSHVPMCSKLSPTFSSIRFSVTRFMMRCLIFLGLSFVHGDNYRSICNLLHVDIQLWLHFFLKILLSIIQFWLLCQKSGVHRCVDWYLGLLFNSIGPPVWFIMVSSCFLLI